MAGGYVKLWRTTLDSQVMTDDWMCRLFIWCILRANYTPGNFKGQPLSPGQFITGRISGAAELSVSPSKWYRGICRLVEIGFLKYEANSSWTTLTVCNWKTYQEDDAPHRTANEQPADSQRTASDTTSGQPADTIEEGKKGRMEEGKKKEEDSSEVEVPPAKPTVKAQERHRPEPMAETVLTFETSGTTACWHLVRPQVEAWQALFPGIDVMQECRSALAWTQANNRKTAGGMMKFLTRWLSTEQNKAGKQIHQRATEPVSRVATLEDLNNPNSYKQIRSQ